MEDCWISSVIFFSSHCRVLIGYYVARYVQPLVQNKTFLLELGIFCFCFFLGFYLLVFLCFVIYKRSSLFLFQIITFVRWITASCLEMFLHCHCSVLALWQMMFQTQHVPCVLCDCQLQPSFLLLYLNNFDLPQWLILQQIHAVMPGCCIPAYSHDLCLEQRPPRLSAVSTTTLLCSCVAWTLHSNVWDLEGGTVSRELEKGEKKGNHGAWL